MKSKLNKTEQSKQYLGRIKNNKYQVAQLGDLCTWKKKKGEANMHGEREREREWCGTLKSF